MIVPSIDLRGGNAVQLIGGEKLAIDAGDPLKIADQFALAGELAVIDLDAALREGSNAEVIEQLCRRADCLWAVAFATSRRHDAGWMPVRRR